jgi:hypothetical protein
MRNTPNLKAERYRIKGPPRTNSGAFLIDLRGEGLPDLRVIVSDGFAWDHVSVSTATRCPTWEEMCLVKELFFKDEECVMQLHPPRSEWINQHPYTLHLWRPQSAEELSLVRIQWQESGEECPWSELDYHGQIPRPPRDLV